MKPDPPQFIPRFSGLHLCCNTAGESANSFHTPTLASTPQELPWGRGEGGGAAQGWGGCPDHSKESRRETPAPSIF